MMEKKMDQDPITSDTEESSATINVHASTISSSVSDPATQNDTNLPAEKATSSVKAITATLNSNTPSLLPAASVPKAQTSSLPSTNDPSKETVKDPGKTTTPSTSPKTSDNVSPLSGTSNQSIVHKERPIRDISNALKRRLSFALHKMQDDESLNSNPNANASSSTSASTVLPHEIPTSPSNSHLHVFQSPQTSPNSPLRIFSNVSSPLISNKNHPGHFSGSVSSDHHLASPTTHNFQHHSQLTHSQSIPISLTLNHYRNLYPNSVNHPSSTSKTYNRQYISDDEDLENNSSAHAAFIKALGNKFSSSPIQFQRPISPRNSLLKHQAPCQSQSKSKSTKLPPLINTQSNESQETPTTKSSLDSTTSTTSSKNSSIQSPKHEQDAVRTLISMATSSNPSTPTKTTSNDSLNTSATSTTTVSANTSTQTTSGNKPSNTPKVNDNNVPASNESTESDEDL
ncbi:hypothetical protein TBLA_0I01630 [Henningerozyma blattae CBS 6284]|uniref:Uncharacterized protein n=1 Tax=Henningerozyma blattae (strain ATCC 34711 / CBS 6284 / DSM 70876 / NBRC 10599 / NRRL Y-10934 / UCD 77-7) TaxID=1071380 RepID=I2H8W9_HENB6|nr:hypothetical protein TBLA_0I01630 [Tetrapisispora blattae CBS 6284]CCH62821.1 hypothetical protein TBLA_0I01630 [Tetrapisispora blattae CBS 6284]